MKRLLWGLALVGLALPVETVRADVVFLTPDRDNSLFSEGQLSNGASDGLWVGHTSVLLLGRRRRALVRFDLSSIPAGATIDSASLSVTVVASSPFGPGATEVRLHRVDEDWGEAGSNDTTFPGQGGSAEAGDATWTDRIFPGTLWTSPGGTFEAAPTATTSVDATGTYVFSSAQMVADLDHWRQNPGLNFGWILVGDETQEATAKRLASREEGPDAPVLQIEYTPPGPGTPFCLGVACPCGNDSPASGCLNSTGAGAVLSGSGSTSVAADDLVLTTTGCPPQNTGLYFVGGSTFPPVFVGDGLACTGGVFRYFPGVVSAGGVFTQTTPVASAIPGAINPGDTRHFQSWTRDVLCGPPPAQCPSPCGLRSNLSNGYTVLFTP